MGAADLRFDIKRKLVPEGGGDALWFPVGSISLWKQDDGRYTGLCTIYALEAEFKVYPHEDKPKGKGKGWQR